MSLFTDQVLLQFRDPAQLLHLLAPASEPNRTRLREFLAAAYDLPFATVHDIQEIAIRRREMERPVFPLTQTSGTWTQTNPTYTRTDVTYQKLNGAEPIWLDLAAEVDVTLVYATTWSGGQPLLPIYVRLGGSTRQRHRRGS